nr:phosphatase domain-containing protein [Corynebacterium lactis]
MSVADVVRKAESKINAFNTARSRNAGWVPTAIGYTGYGNAEQLRVFARVLMRSPDQPPRTAAARGFRQFFTIQVGGHPVRVSVGKQTIEAVTDDNGYVEALVRDHGLAPGWHEVTIEAVGGAESTTADVLILDPAAKVGIVSDIDDTVMVTMLPRAMIAAYNSWFLRTDARKAVPGFSEFYAALRRRHAGQSSRSAHSGQASQPAADLDQTTPVFYLSTGAWNTFETLRSFLRANRLPRGPLLLTDWGPTPTGLFRSGQEHKRVQLRNLFIDFPDIKWFLVGDDGQHDPLIYGQIAAEHPDRVAGIAIRNLTPSEHILSHGTTFPIDRLERTHVPFIEGADGFELLSQAGELSSPGA